MSDNVECRHEVLLQVDRGRIVGAHLGNSAGQASSPDQGVLQEKFAGSLVLPVPLYCDTLG